MPSRRPLIVGRGLSFKKGFLSRSEFILRDALAERGLRVDDVDFAEPWEAKRRLFGRNVILALGDDAARACVPDWEGGVQDRRGYLFEGFGGVKVIPSVHPDLVAKAWLPWRMFLSYDIQRFNDESHQPDILRPERHVEVVGSASEAERAVRELLAARRLAFDIEIYDTERVSCVGFAPSPHRAVVFPARFFADAARVLTSRVPKIAQNGQFDLHFLLTRCGVRVENFADDTLLAWHACYPELAGASQDASGKRRNKTTRKSLAFFASLFTADAWWKDYDFQDELEMYVLNGRDCCITYDVLENHLEPLVDSLGVRGIYEHEVRLVWPVVEMQARGLRIDDALRQERVRLLDERIEGLGKKLAELALPLIEEKLETLPDNVQGLFRKRARCSCCLNAKRKAHCWSCAGFDKEPSKQALLDYLTSRGWLADKGDKKAALLEMLPPCRECEGAGEFHWLEFNGRSVPQKQALLYDVLKLPKKMKDGVLRTDEDALRNLLAHVS